MTENEWLTSKEAQPLLVFVEDMSSNRKARLFACGLGRALWPFLSDERSRRLVEVVERYADDSATASEFALAHLAAQDAIRGTASRIASWIGDNHAWQGARVVAVGIQEALNDHTAQDWSGWVAKHSRKLVDCVFGNPFRPVTIGHSMLPPAAIMLAQTIYNDRTFDQMPELANVLVNTGCDNADVLDHCCGPGPHVRGCWVLDLLLGKE